MDEDKKTQTFEGEDAVEQPVTDAASNAKPQFKIDLFQTARVHTETFTEEFDTREEAEEFARKQCRDKGIELDFEIEQLPVVAPSAPEAAEPESENLPEDSGEKTTQENGLPLN